MTLVAQRVFDMISQLAAAESAVLPPLDVANQAGRWMCRAHAWRWLVRPPAHLNLRGTISLSGATWTNSTKTLTKTGAFTNYAFLDGDEAEITSGTGATPAFYKIASKSGSNAIVLQSSIGSAADGQTDIAGTMRLYGVALPVDFAEVVELVPDQGLFSEAREIDYESLLRLRTQTPDSMAQIYYYAFSMADTLARSAPVQRLELARAPAANDTGGIQLVYRRKWPDLGGDSEEIRIPDWLEGLYLRAVFQQARSWVFEAPTAAQRMNELRASQEWHDALRADGALSGTVGPMRGGAAQMYSPTSNRYSSNNLLSIT